MRIVDAGEGGEEKGRKGGEGWGIERGSALPFSQHLAGRCRVALYRRHQLRS